MADTHPGDQESDAAIELIARLLVDAAAEGGVSQHGSPTHKEE